MHAHIEKIYDYAGIKIIKRKNGGHIAPNRFMFM